LTQSKIGLRYVIDTGKNCLLTSRYRGPKCGKRYAVAEWKQNPKCRQCGAELHADNEQGALSSQSQRAGQLIIGDVHSVVV